MLNAAQGKHLAVQHHEIVAQMHKYVLIAVELSVQGRQKRLLTQVTPFYRTRPMLPKTKCRASEAGEALHLDVEPNFTKRLHATA